MKAIVQDEYGPPRVLEVRDIDVPPVRHDEVLVRVLAGAINPGDWDLMHGSPYVLRLATGLRTPRHRVLGLSVAGRVEAVGRDIVEPRIGDEVYAGISHGGFAEYVAVRASLLAPKPSRLTFEQAAAVPVTGTTALQALRDVGRVKPGEKVLVNGASGGVGTFAVQIAKSFGADITGVCSTANVDLVHSIGADHVIDYTQDDFITAGHRYDLILDNVGNRTLSELRRALTPRGTLIPNSNKGGGPWMGRFLPRAAQALVVSPFVSQRLRPFAGTDTREDLIAMTDLIERGEVEPVVDRVFAQDDLAEALSYYGTGHARGKVIITMAPPKARERGD